MVPAPNYFTASLEALAKWDSAFSLQNLYLLSPAASIIISNFPIRADNSVAWDALIEITFHQVPYRSGCVRTASSLRHLFVSKHFSFRNLSYY